MTGITFHSQAKQDQFVFDLLVKGRGQGFFLDIGSGDPITNNNTAALESIGWEGIMMEMDSALCDKSRQLRTARVVQADATQFDWNQLSRKGYDYLSLDIDEQTPIVLEKLLAAGYYFKCATIEHDAYRFGDAPRQKMREAMRNAGYHLLLGDISVTPGFPFEDWWVDAGLAKVMFNLDPYLSRDTTIPPPVPCIPCGQKRS